MLIQRLKIILNSNIFLGLLILITLSTIFYEVNHINSKYNSSTKEFIGIIKEIKNDGEKIILTIKARENIIVYYSGNLVFNLGDRVKVKGDLNPIESNTIFNLFNYKKYMLSKNTYYSIKADNISIIKKNKNIFYKLKSFIMQRINTVSCKEYLKAFILGDSSEINKTAVNSYRNNGISHLFSVSGMHVTILSTIILYILNKIKKSNINYFFVILFLIFYVFLTGFSPSIIRATFLFALLIINKIFKINLKTYRVLLFIMCFNLIINPYNIYNTGFKFSYTISLFLIVFNKTINRNKNYILKILITSFISFVSSMPILINNYFSINIMTIFNNIIFVPLVSLIIFPLSLIVLFVPKLCFIYKFTINILESLSIFMCYFKIDIVLSKMNIFMVAFYYFVIIFILYKICYRKYKYILLIIIIIIIHTNVNYIVRKTYITFFDVKQGDSVLIHLHSNHNILIDTGGLYSNYLYENMINYLKSKGIKKIDYLVLSHGDYDHMGEAINLVNSFKVEKVIFNCGKFNDLEKELIKVLDKKKIKYYSCIKELNINNNKLYFLQTKEYDNENDNSNVIYTEINNYKFLFMGDAEIEKEKDILDKYNISDVDVLKVGHHGSKTSSGKDFIDEINPKYSIISVGKNNRYGHPNKEVLDNLKESKIYRTDQVGSIMFKIKNNKIKIEICSS